ANYDGGRKIMPEVRKLFRAMTSKGLHVPNLNEHVHPEILVPTMISEKRRAHYQGYNT
ncbi:unnamed protein product, partial [Effrenium voratum]